MMIGYKESGVDIEAGYKSVELIKEDVKRTFRPEVLGGLGGFGGMFAPNLKGIEEPVMVSGTDGVGTKLKIAFLLNEHKTIGIDCVAMCVNDIICSGAQPLFFMDYIAVGKNIPEKIGEIVKGISDGCVSSGCSLIGGETAEMPGFYENEEYDVAGFAVGMVDKKKIIDGQQIKEGDQVIGIASSGLHSNGYSLVRKLLNINRDPSKLQQYIESIGKTLGEELLTPTKIYVKIVMEIISNFNIKGIAHITGGGFVENIPRILPNGLGVKIFEGTWPVHPIFTLLRDMGDLNMESMYNTFNMGIGMVLVVSEEKSKDVVEKINESGEQGYIIGEILTGHTGVTIC
jgi:phosphoribosylformylglycinamidine cyclo-ligase